jgi:hypothetical protein
MVAQQFEVSEFVKIVCGEAIGVRKPMLSVTTANKNRAGSFIVCSLSAIGIF